MANISQFYKTILLLMFSVGIFFALKYFLPDRLFPETTGNDASMLIDSVLLDALEGNILVEVVDTLDKVYVKNADGAIETRSTIKDTLGVLLINKAAPYSSTANYIKPFKNSNFYEKLEKRKPILFFPDIEKKYVVEKPVTDTLLDPTISLQGYGYLQRFYSKLKNLESTNQGRVRVAYFGDSMNDGDFIVQDVRSLFQDNFGGSGVGLVSITSLSSASRGSVYHRHSSNWFTQSFVSVRRPSTPFGVDGQVFLAQGPDNYWASYAAGNTKHSTALYNPTLLYGYSENQNGIVDVTIDNDGKEALELSPQYGLNTLNLGITQANSIKLNFSNAQNIPIYGLNFSSYTGVHVDNFSLRGNSGLTLVGLNTTLMNAFDRILNYDLIVLHYGTNVLSYGSLDYTFYEKSMTSVINKLKHCFPNADILVISTADKASKINMQMATDPAVVALAKTQKRFSRETGAGFIDLYSLMGGQGSMVDWVNKQMANKDYTHFNIKGSKKIGALLFDEIERGYIKYKTQLEKDQERQSK